MRLLESKRTNPACYASADVDLSAVALMRKELAAAGVKVKKLAKIQEGRPNVIDLIKNGEIQMVINTPAGMIPRRDENAIRSAAYAHNVCIMTTITGAQAAVQGIDALKNKYVGVRAIQKYKGNVNIVG